MWCGKSGIIANKISATLSSIGTPPFHSRLMIVLMVIWVAFQKDVLILISYSGNSLELKILLIMQTEIKFY